MAAGARVIRYPDLFPTSSLRMKWLKRTRTDCLEFEGRLYDIAGRANPFFVPSWSTEFELTGPVSAGAITFSITEFGYQELFLDRPGEFSLGKLLFFANENGDLFIVKALSVIAAGGVETVTVQDPLPFDVTIETSYTGFVYFVRFNSDRLSMMFNGTHGSDQELTFTADMLTVHDLEDFPSDELRLEDEASETLTFEDGVQLTQVAPPSGMILFDDFQFYDNEPDDFSQKLDAYSGYGAGNGALEYKSEFGIYILATFEGMTNADPTTQDFVHPNIDGNGKAYDAE